MSVFDWCFSGQHDICKREYERFIIDPRTNKAVFLGEIVKCECRKRGCKCYIKPADREKPARKRAKTKRK